MLRYQGPVAAGMPEVVLAASALSVPELNGKVALIPAVPAFIVSRDEDKQEIVIRVIPGLLDS